MLIHWPTKDDLLHYAQQVAAFAEKAKEVAAHLQTNPTVQGLEAHMPYVSKVLAAVERVAPMVLKAASHVPTIENLYAAYEVYKSLGGKPMDWGNPEGESKWLAQHVEEQNRRGG